MPVHPGTGLLAAFAVTALLLSPTRACAQDVKAGDLVIHQPWTRATPPGAQVASGYFTVINNGTVPDRLIGGSFEASSGFEFHEMSMDGGVMKMRPTGPVAITAGGTLELSPSGKHVMLKGLKHGLKQGQHVQGTLVFEHAGTVPVRFDVAGIGAKAPDAAGDHSMPGMDMN